LFALFKKSGLMTIHGPVLRDLLKGDGANATLLVKLMTSQELTTVNFPSGTAVKKGKSGRGGDRRKPQSDLST